jgi:hypothetical protein
MVSVVLRLLFLLRFRAATSGSGFLFHYNLMDISGGCNKFSCCANHGACLSFLLSHRNSRRAFLPVAHCAEECAGRDRRAGRVVEVFVAENDPAEEGQLLLTLEKA